MNWKRNKFGRFPMNVEFISPGLVFLYDQNVYLKTMENNFAVNISTGEMKLFDPDLVVEVVEFEYSY